jgi:bifunctional non-homologous end joining protein LigD
MHVEDHPIEYGGFEGVIPEKQYGAGTVMLWDRGTWQPIGDAGEGYRKGHLKFTLDGEKLHGAWTLIRTHGSRYGGKSEKQAWLLIKERDAVAQSGGVPIVERMPDSVATGRSLAQIASARSNVWESKKSVRENVKAGAIALAPPKASKVAKLASKPATPTLPEGAKKASMPATIAPMLTTLVSDAPSGDAWLHEIKYDGYRMVVRIERGKARLYSRTGKDWTAAFERLAKDLAKLPVKNAWVDGEVVVLDDEGRTSFQALQNALSGGEAKFAYFAFDLMYRDGIDLRAAPLSERKRLLRETVGNGIGAVRVGPEVQGHGDEFFRQACSLSLEGAGVQARGLAVSRRLAHARLGQGQVHAPAGDGHRRLHRAPGRPHRLRRADAGRLRGRQAPLLRQGRHRLRRRDARRPLQATAQARARRRAVRRPAARVRGARGALGRAGSRRPGRVHRMERRRRACGTRRSSACAWTRRRARSCARKPRPRRRVACAPAAKKTAAKTTKGAKAATVGNVVAGIAISNPDKPYFPESGLAKIDIARYYEAMAPRLLPYIAKRPLSLVRCPDGWNGQCFYQKNADKSVNAAVDRIEVPRRTARRPTWAPRAPQRSSRSCNGA